MPDRSAFALHVDKYFLVMGACLIANVGVGVHGAAAQGLPESLADQIRMQGHSCDRLISAERDTGRSKPNAVVWTIKCANAAYRMTVIPDMAARVEPLSP